MLKFFDLNDFIIFCISFSVLGIILIPWNFQEPNLLEQYITEDF